LGMFIIFSRRLILIRYYSPARRNIPGDIL
jgi:hypothetical protein